MDPTMNTTSNEVAKEESEKEKAKKDSSAEEDVPSMPWTDFQEWALRDNLPRYVVSIPVQDDSSKKQKQQLYGLWRTMMREVTELGGYPIEMLQEMHARQLQQNDDATLSETPKTLPLLDQFAFEASGGLSGQVYGIPGIADGTRIVTNEVKEVQLTVPKGYVQTQDGAVAYELGTPLRESYSLDVANSKVRDVSSLAANTAAGIAKATADEDPDTMLVRVGFLTAVMLGGATAINMLSHHLTVNVFWV